MKVAVIGGAGKMGAWFASYFSSRGSLTTLSDVRIEDARRLSYEIGAKLAETNIGAVKNADLVLICVPIERTPEVISEVVSHMKKGAILAEVSSVKRGVIKALRETASLDVQPLSIHPMFGPLAKSLRGKTIVVIPVIEEEAEVDLARRLFDEAEIVVSEQREHDRVMAVILSLPYLMNLAFARVLENGDLNMMKKMAGTTFTIQLAIAESIVKEDLGLTTSLLKENPYAEFYADRFIEETRKIKELIKGSSKNINELYESLRTFLERDSDYSQADEKRYKAFEAMKKWESTHTNNIK